LEPTCFVNILRVGGDEVPRFPGAEVGEERRP
jgi:hypothetical protein